MKILLIQILEIIKWPGVVIIAVFLLRKPLSELIINIADFKITTDGLMAKIARPKSKYEKPIKYTGETQINSKYFSKDKKGEVIFDYSNNNGVYTIGENEYKFDTQWSKASNKYIHFYNDQPSIKSVRLAKDVNNLININPIKYDDSSRARTVGIGQIAIFENTNNKFLVIKILGLKDDSRGDDKDEIHFSYKILD